MATVTGLETLARIELFQPLTPEEIEQLDTACIWRRVDAKQWIIDYQDESTDVFFLVSGVARVMILSISGREAILRDINAGAVFGEYSADGQTRSASILAITDVTIARMAAATFLDAVLQRPEVSFRLLRLITYQARMLTNRVNDSRSFRFANVSFWSSCAARAAVALVPRRRSFRRRPSTPISPDESARDAKS